MFLLSFRSNKIYERSIDLVQYLKKQKKQKKKKRYMNLKSKIDTVYDWKKNYAIFLLTNE